MSNKCGCCKLSSISLGVSAAAICALGMLVLGVLAMQYGIGLKWIELAGNVYKGYAATWHGIGIGAGLAAIKGFVGGLLFGWIYNLCACCLGKCCRCCKIDKDKQITPAG